MDKRLPYRHNRHAEAALPTVYVPYSNPTRKISHMDVYSVVGALVVAVISSFITAHIALWRFRKSTQWERKAEAYDRVIQALGDLQFVLETLEDEAVANAYSEPPPPTEDGDHDSKVRKANFEIRKATLLGSYLFSKEALRILEEYGSDEYNAGEEGHWQGFVNTKYGAVKTCLRDFIPAAQRDLKS